MLCAPLPSTIYNNAAAATTTSPAPAPFFMQNTTNTLPDGAAAAITHNNNRRQTGDTNNNNNCGMMLPPPPMPRGVSFKLADERSYSLPVGAGGRTLPGSTTTTSQPTNTNSHRSVSFSDTVSTVNFPVLPSANCGPNNNHDDNNLFGGGAGAGRIVSKDNLLQRASSIGSLNDDLDLSFSSLSSTFMNEETTTNATGGSDNHSNKQHSCDCKSTPSKDPMLEPNQIENNKNSSRSSNATIGSSSSSFSTCFEDDMRTILHRACQQFPRKKQIVKNALKKDPSAVRRRAFIPGVPCNQKSNNGASKQRAAPEPYQLPINIALVHKASLDVLDMLVKADATQLAEKDGINGSNSLCLALERRPNDIAVLGMFLVSNPILVKRNCDNSNNTPLHVACQRGSCLPIIRQLFQLHPPALFQRNEMGKTPIDILQQQATVCPKSKTSLKFLQEKQQQLASAANMR